MATGVAVLLLAVARVAVLETFTVTSESMRPTLSPGDRLVVLKTTGVTAGDVVVFDGTRLLGPGPAAAGGPRAVVDRLFGVDPATAYVKRVIGLPGDRVACCSEDGRIVRNGEPLSESYVTGPTDGVEFDVTVPPERYWVMGDNRADSADSRSALGRPGGGMLRADDIVGEAVWRYWPLGDRGALSSTGPHDAAAARTPTPAVGDIGNTAGEFLPPQPKESAP